ncbi:MAG: hypothetical protein M1497_12225 [Nitrospirae bacterium]|nr:hypothetical protein [Nitrospirota bacterium]
MKKKSRLALFVLCVSLPGIAILPLSLDAAAMQDYCVVPPFAGFASKPNVLLLMDFSSSMQFPVYVGCDRSGRLSVNGVNDCLKFNSGYDYSGTKNYFGYFDPHSCYTPVSNRFETSGCDCSDRKGAGTCMSGNLLNWIAMTRIDIAKKVLIGGKSSTGNAGFLESQGAAYVYYDANLKCNFTVRPPNNNAVRELTVTGNVCSNDTKKACGTNADCGAGNACRDMGCVFGNTSIANVKVLAKVDSRAIRGVVDDIWDKVTIEFMEFGNTNGTIKASKDATKASLVQAISNEFPGGSTPTGNGLWEAYDYYRQDNDHSFVANTNDLKKGDGGKDPFYDGTGNSSAQVPCRRGFVLLLSDGAWKQGADPVIPAKSMTSLRRTDFTHATPVLTYPVFSWGDLDSETPGNQGRRAMITTAIFGGFEDFTGDRWPYPFTGFSTTSQGTCSGQGDGKFNIKDRFGTTYCNSRNVPALTATPYPLDHCDPSGTWDPSCSEWDFDRMGLPYNFFEASDGNSLRTALLNAVYDMLRRVSSGTATSVLASAEGSGANLLQGTFYPKRRLMNTLISWTGSLKSLWYYVDPFFRNSSVREDSTMDNVLNLSNDNIIRFRYDNMLQNTVADVCIDPSCSGVSLTKPFESILNLWDSGLLLWQREPSMRMIFTTLDGTSLVEFAAGSNNATLNSYLQAPDNGTADRIVSYARGMDYNFRHCSVTVGSSCDYDADCPAGETCSNAAYCSRSISTPCVSETDCPSGETCAHQYRNRTVSIDVNGNGMIDTGETHVWKLGDVLDSTPKVASWMSLNAYHTRYGDKSYGPSGDPQSDDPSDTGHYLTTPGYKGRGIVFAGANDGMFHAFRLGTLRTKWGGQGDTQMAWLENTDAGSQPLGREMWAFIPKNALPYLKYMTDANYCHIFTVDLAPFIFDASIGAPDAGDVSGNTRTAGDWRTVVIGGMRFGGACRSTAQSCNGGSTDCVKTPIAGVGYSSYFALDVTDYLANQTDPANHPPKLLWEFSDDALGFSSSGPAVVRTGDRTKNGNWYVVLGSGPTGPIDTISQQFLGRSDQSLKIFVLNLKDGSRAVNPSIESGIGNAFAGSMVNATNDTDLDYQDDVVYIPYVRKDETAGTWTGGGVLRLLTHESGPSSWTLSRVIENIGPVTSGPARVVTRKKDKVWLFLGTGRYYFKTRDSVDDPGGQRRLFGIKDPCFTETGFLLSCPSALSGIGGLVPASGSSATEPETGWYVDLDGTGNFAYPEGNPATQVTRGYGAERVITDILATTTGLVFFASYKPYLGVCNVGGKSFLWAVRYNTGGSAAGALKGKGLVQVSTGSIEQLDLGEAFKQSAANPDSREGRRSAAMEGVPPTAQGLSVLSPPPPVKRVLHTIEK